MNATKIVASGLIVGLCGMTFGYDTTGYRTLTATDNGTSSSSFATGANWDNQLPPGPATNYLVSGKSIKLYSNLKSGTSDPFRGEKLALESGGLLYLYDKQGVEVPQLDLLDGGIVQSAAASYCLSNSTVSVFSSADNPARLEYNPSANSQQAAILKNSSLVGAVDTCLLVKLYDASSKTYSDVCVELTDIDATQYLGAIRYQRGKYTPNIVAGLNGIVCAGALTMESNTTVRLIGAKSSAFGRLVSNGDCTIELSPSASLSAGALELAAGTTLAVASSAVQAIAATDSLAVDGQVLVSGLHDIPADDPKDEIALISVPSGVSIDTSKFIAEGSPAVGSKEFSGFVVRDNVLYATYAHVIAQVTADTSNDPETSSFLEKNKDHWEGGQPLSSEEDYYTEKTIQTPGPDSGVNSFGGRSLTIGDGGLLSVGAKSVSPLRIDDLRMTSGASIESFMHFCLEGRLRVEGDVKIQNRNDRLFTLASVLCGDGSLLLRTGYGRTDVVANPKASFALTADNGEFTGKIALTTPSPVYKDKDAKAAGIALGPNDEYCARIWVADQRNLGGACPEFVCDALDLQYFSQLNVTNNLVMDEPTRGVKITGCGRFNVDEGMAFTLTNKVVTYDGVLKKEGLGEMILGGATRFGAGTVQSEPQVGGNVLAVTAGSLKPSSTNCLDGVKCVVSDGAELLFDLAPTAEGMAEYGVVNMREPENTPFAVAAGSVVGTIPVRFVKDANTPHQGTVAIGTFRDAQTANSVRGLLDLGKYGNRVSTRQNDDGSATLVVNYGGGLILIVQ